VTEHLSEDERVLLFYGEAQDEASQRAHLETCSECRAAMVSLESLLAALREDDVPERGEDFARAIWERVRPQRTPVALVPRGGRVLPFARRLAPFLALAASLLIAFQLGRVSRVGEPITAVARQRILLVAVSEHLERTQMVLVELQNAGGGNGEVDLSSERQWAQELVPSNRLYRQAAAHAGETGMANVLEDLERLLVEVANGPERISPAAFQEIQARIESQGILFKVRVIESQVRERQRELPRDVKKGLAS
jgi:anti-sigma factor RsiW